MARSLLKSMGMPAKFWGEAVSTAVYLLNRAPTKSVKGMTPYETWHGRKPSVHHLRTFGSTTRVKKIGPGQTKLADRSKQMVMIGYETGSKAYRLYDPETRKLVVARDVVLEEDRPWDWSSPGSSQTGDQEPLVVLYPEQRQQGSGEHKAKNSPETPAVMAKAGEMSAAAEPRLGVKTRQAGDGKHVQLPLPLSTPVATSSSDQTASATPYSEPSQGPQGKRLLTDFYEEDEPDEAEYRKNAGEKP
jgi:hypothetical protein